jgi:hypothetical protein
MGLNYLQRASSHHLQVHAAVASTWSMELRRIIQVKQQSKFKNAVYFVIAYLYVQQRNTKLRATERDKFAPTTIGD